MYKHRRDTFQSYREEGKERKRRAVPFSFIHSPYSACIYTPSFFTKFVASNFVFVPHSISFLENLFFSLNYDSSLRLRSPLFVIVALFMSAPIEEFRFALACRVSVRRRIFLRVEDDCANWLRLPLYVKYVSSGTQIRK